MYSEDLIKGNVPKSMKNRVRENMNRYHLSLADAFEEAARVFARPGTELWNAWYFSDYRAYIPSAYLPEYLDFEKHPLKYEAIGG